jgi:predicted GNAT family acetyltransferase
MRSWRLFSRARVARAPCSQANPSISVEEVQEISEAVVLQPRQRGLRGKGAASRLMAGVMEIVRAEGLKARPLCGYASAWMWRHP